MNLPHHSADDNEESHELVRRIVSGDRRAFEQFLSGRYGGLILKTARTYGAALIADGKWSVEDLFQEAIIHIAKSNCRPACPAAAIYGAHTVCASCGRDWWVLRSWLSLSEPKVKLAGWLVAVVRRRMFSLVRADKNKLKTVDVSITDASIEELLRDDLAPWEEGDLIDVIRVGLPKLSKEQRDILWLRIQGYTISESAAELGISESAANSRISRALKLLASMAE